MSGKEEKWKKKNLDKLRMINYDYIYLDIFNKNITKKKTHRHTHHNTQHKHWTSRTTKRRQQLLL